MRKIGTAIAALGALLLALAAVSVLWQEPVSALYNDAQQQELRSELASSAARASLGGGLERLRNQRVLAGRVGRQSAGGRPIGLLRIDKIGLQQVVVEGVGESDLERGPGHYPETALPGRGTTVAIAGHRTTFGAPFRDLDQLKRDDAVEFTLPYGQFTYRVERSFVTKPRDLSALRPAGYERLVLTSCHPVMSASERLVTVAKLERARPAQLLARLSS